MPRSARRLKRRFRRSRMPFRLPCCRRSRSRCRKLGSRLEERFNLTFNNVPANQFFMAIVSGTRYNMLVHPDVVGTISANLKDVTLFEALDAIRELYGYDYKVDGTRIVIKPLTLQTSVFQVNYLTGSRKGASDTRVSSGSVSRCTQAGTAGAGQISYARRHRHDRRKAARSALVGHRFLDRIEGCAGSDCRQRKRWTFGRDQPSVRRGRHSRNGRRIAKAALI